ncbi:hypothetical protein PIB30_075013 [Stylosanthes scabra]|uniref:Transposase (putative) gypsy type domain-containing protein n=1 Tax=Stylosanthes scabra TaxID=79078 RepID=A0ABU6QPF2_9FABA|nr:hypothetical protein [Stylosanthes scabra]
MARRVAHEMLQLIPKCCEWIESAVLGAKSIVDEDFVKSFCEHHDFCSGRTEKRKYQVVAPDIGDRACYVVLEVSSCIFVYEAIFTKIGVKIPFSEFEIEVLRECEIAPSQIHPNSWGFIRAYQVICREFGISTSLGVFHHLFNLTKPFSKDKQQWLSFRANQGRKVFEMYEESVKDFKNLCFKIISQPGTTPFWIDGEGECQFPLSWNKEWVDPKADRNELSELELFFVDTLSECWGEKDHYLLTRMLHTKSSHYIQDKILGKMSGKSSAYDRFKAHLLSQSKKPVPTLKSGFGADRSVSPNLSALTSSSVPESSSAKTTSATPSPQLSIHGMDNSEKSVQEPSPSRKRKTYEPKYRLINSKEFDHTGFTQEYLVGGNNKISMDGENFMKNLDFTTRTCIKAAAICQATQNKLRGSLVVPEGEVEPLRTRVKAVEAEKNVIEGEKFELSSKITTLEARLALESQDLNATKELLRKIEKEKLDGKEKKLEEELQAVKELCDQFSMDGMLVVEETVTNLKAQLRVLLPQFDVDQIGRDNRVVDRVIICTTPVVDEQSEPEGVAVDGGEQVEDVETSELPPTPPC